VLHTFAEQTRFESRMILRDFKNILQHSAYIFCSEKIACFTFVENCFCPDLTNEFESRFGRRYDSNRLKIKKLVMINRVTINTYIDLSSTLISTNGLFSHKRFTIGRKVLIWNDRFKIWAFLSSLRKPGSLKTVFDFDLEKRKDFF
jgi:hypothetical protein